MELRQLRYFLAVAEEGRFSRAARRLHIAAPSLSQQIQALERDLRVILFERSPERVALTPAGEVLERHARVVLTEADRAVEEVRATEGGRREQLVLRVCTMAEPVLDGPLRDATQGIPGVQVSVGSSPGDDAVEAVRQARADAAVVWSRPPGQRDLPGVVLGSVPCGVALPLGHPLSGDDPVPAAALAGETLVMYPRPPFAGIWDRVVDHVLPGGAAPGQVVVEPDMLNAPDAVVRAVAAGTGVAVVVLALAGHLGAGVEVRDLDPPLRLDLELVWRDPARAAVRSLVASLADAAQDPHALIDPPTPAAGAPHGAGRTLSPASSAPRR